MKMIISRVGQYAKAFLKWTAISAVIGLIGGLLGSIFHISIDYMAQARESHAWILYLMPIGGLLIVWLYRTFHANRGVDTNLVLESVRKEKDIPFMMAPLIFIGTLVTHLVGGSAGREGAALQLGGCIGYRIGKLIHLNRDDLHMIVMSGMSAVFAAMFGTPLTAAFFALEVTTVGIMHYAGLVPCLMASLLAYVISGWMGIEPVRFSLNISEPLSAGLVLRTILLALVCALISILFCVVIRFFCRAMKKLFPNAYLRVIIGALVLITLTCIDGSDDYNGAGMEVITRAMQGNARSEAFLMKLLFTAITIASGYKGGEIVPAFFVGSTFGCVAGTWLGLDAGIGAAVGLIALFCGVVNCPVASVLLALELFGADGILLFGLVCGVSYMMSGNYSLYRSQMIMYSKLDSCQTDAFTDD